MLESNYSGQYEEPLLEKAISWIDNIVLSWLQFAFGSESKKGKSRLLDCTFSSLWGRLVVSNQSLEGSFAPFSVQGFFFDEASFLFFLAVA